MPERRKEERPDSTDRRTAPRPSLRLNLIVLGIAIALGIIALVHRASLERSFEKFVVGEPAVSEEVARVRTELLHANLTEQQLREELNSRLSYANALKSEDFFLSIHPADKVLRFQYGNVVVREAPLTVGAPLTVSGPEGQWTFAEFQGATHVERKLRGHTWSAEPWAYRMKGEAAPAEPPAIEGGLGRYVIELPNGYLIHSPPAEQSPLDGPKPASFMVPEEDLAAIWPRLADGTPVFVF